MTRDKGNSPDPAAVDPEPDGDSPWEPTVDRAAQTQIGDHLRSMYNELMQQPVPDRLMDLLARLDDGKEEKTR